MLAILGGGLVAIGVALPWFSMFAGLQPVSALGTENGTLLLVGAGLAIGLGVLAIVRDSAFARRALVLAGVGLVAFGAYLMVGFVSVYGTVSTDPMLVAAPGPGLAIVIVGALLILASAMVRD